MTTEETTMTATITDCTKLPKDHPDYEPLPPMPLPVHLAVLPVNELGESFAAWSRHALTGSPGADPNAATALRALSYSTALIEAVAAQVPPLMVAARLAGASADDIAARVGGR